MTRELSKAFMNESKSGNKYHKWQKKQSILEIAELNLQRKIILKRLLKRIWVNNKAFSNTIKPFLTNKGFNLNESIAIRNKDKILKIVTDKTKLVELFRSHYINRIEKTSAMWPEIEGKPELKNNDQSNIKTIYSIILALTILKIVMLTKNTLISKQGDWCN